MTSIYYSLFRLIALATVLLAFHTVHADVTLYVPGFDEEPLSASVLGIDAGSSHTTYALLPGTQTGAVPAPTFTEPATLIEGPADVRLISGDHEISCTIKSDFAYCIGERGYPVTPEALGTAARFVVQGGDIPSTTAAPAATQVVVTTSAAPGSTTKAPRTTPTNPTSALPTLGSAASVTAPPSSATAVTALASATALRTLINSAAPSAAEKLMASLSAICMSLLGACIMMLL